MRGRPVVAGLVGGLLAVVMPSAAAGAPVRPSVPGTVRLVSATPNGQPGDRDSCYAGALSDDGRYAVFGSMATDLVPGDPPAGGAYHYHAYWRDLQTGRTVLLDRTRLGVLAENDSYPTSVSADGRYVAFTSEASNLAGGAGITSVYVHDLHSGRNRLVSTAATGGGANGDSDDGELSDDGAKVLFRSFATDLVPGVTAGPHLYLRDLRTGGISVVTATPTGGSSQVPFLDQQGSLSGDGSSVVFTSNAPELLPGPQPVGPYRLFVRDLATGMLSVVRRPDGLPLTVSHTSRQADRPRVSRDGQVIAFTARGETLGIPTATRGAYDTFAHDRRTGSNELVSRSTQGDPAAVEGSRPLQISGDGRYVLFRTKAVNLVPPLVVHQESWQDYLHDRVAGTTRIVERRRSGEVRGASALDLSGDGRTLLYHAGRWTPSPHRGTVCVVYTRTRTGP